MTQPSRPASFLARSATLFLASAALTAVACSEDPSGPDLGGGGKGDEPGPAADAEPGDVRATIALPGTFFPESVTAAPDGTLFTGNPTNGEIVRVRPGSDTAEVFVAAGVNKGSFGMAVDEATGVLWVCDVDLSPAQAGSNLKSFRLTDGGLEAAHPLPAGGGCADITIDREGTLYVTDTFRDVIMRLVPGGALEASWCADPAFVGGDDPQNPLTINGITHIQQGEHTALFTNRRDTGTLYRVMVVTGVEAASCGAAVPLTLDLPLILSDGIRAIDADTLLVAVNVTPVSLATTDVPLVGAILQIDLTGDSGTGRMIADQLDQPTSIALVGDDAWIAEGQILRLIGVDDTGLNLPFVLRRLPLP